MRSSRSTAAAAFLAVVGSAACSTATRDPSSGGVRPAAAVDTSRAPAAPADSGGRRYGEADVRFIQHMIAHHGQALTMTALVPARASREDVRRLAERIAISQHDEIALMRRWLRDRGEPEPAADTTAPAGHHAGGHDAAMPGMPGGMPGMLTPDELARLTAATGDEFDQLFLQYMIRHHEGALAMVAELLATPGAGQEVAIFRLASDVDADQRAEIRRMRAMQGAPSAGAPHR